MTYRVVTFAKGLRLMSMKPATEPGFTEGAGGAYGQGFGCVRPGLIEQVSWGTATTDRWRAPAIRCPRTQLAACQDDEVRCSNRRDAI